MNIPKKIRQTYSEVDEFLNLLSKEKQNEIPKELRDLFKNEKDKEYVKKINKNIEIDKQNLKEETLAIIALLNLKYWCKNEKEKSKLKEIYFKNEQKYQEILIKKYNTNKIFENNKIFIQESSNIEKNDNENLYTIKLELKESRLKKVINNILKFLHIE